MKNRYVLFVSLLCLVHSAGFGQIGAKTPVSDWKAVSVSQHQKGRWLVGLGPTFLGVTAKAGCFVANRTWIGIEGEIHSLLSDRQEIGTFARYYLWNGGLLSGFASVGVSYGRFRAWDWDFDGDRPEPETYREPKVSTLLGLEYPLGRRVSLEGAVKVGRLVRLNWTQPSLQISCNVSLGK